MRRQRRDYEAVIRDTFIQEGIAKLKTDYQAADEHVTPEMIDLMKKLRERFIELELPTIVKVLRLTYEQVDQDGKFDFVYTGPKPEEEEEESEEESSEVTEEAAGADTEEGVAETTEETPEPEVEEEEEEELVTLEDLGVSSYEYLLQLIRKPTNKYNREEIREFAAQLKALNEE